MAKKAHLWTTSPSGSPVEIDYDALIFQLPPLKPEPIYGVSEEPEDWGVRTTSIPSLWRLTQGEGIRIAVLDTGIDFYHPDLEQSIVASKNFTKDSRFGPADMHGHGTHVAGIIAARRRGEELGGVAPKAQLLGAKVLDQNGLGSPQSVIKGLKWAVKKNAHIISMSFGVQNAVEEVHQAIQEVVKEGIFCIAAAGNERYEHVEYPAAHPECVAVGSVNQNGHVTSSRGPGNKVDIVAPGHNIRSTYPPRTYRRLSGTSMAVPFVTGVVALMLAKHRDYEGTTPINTHQDLLDHLYRIAIDLPPEGRDEGSGWGLIDPR